jgi:hypothetical protein
MRLIHIFSTNLLKGIERQPPNGKRYWQVRELADKSQR